MEGGGKCWGVGYLDCRGFSIASCMPCESVILRIDLFGDVMAMAMAMIARHRGAPFLEQLPH